MDSTDALSRSRCRERRLNNVIGSEINIGFYRCTFGVRGLIAIIYATREMELVLADDEMELVLADDEI